jgi:hypothetical protein
MNKLNQYLSEASLKSLKIAQTEMMQQSINNNNNNNNSFQYNNKYQYLMLGIHSTFQSFDYIMKNNNDNNTGIYQVSNSGVFPMITYYNEEQDMTLSTRSLIMNEHIFLTTNVKGFTRKISFPPDKFFKMKTTNNSCITNKRVMLLDLELLGQVIFLKLILKYLPEPGFSTPELDGIPMNCSRHIYGYLVRFGSSSSSSKGEKEVEIPYRNVYPVICSRTREASCV